MPVSSPLLGFVGLGYSPGKMDSGPKAVVNEPIVQRLAALLTRRRVRFVCGAIMAVSALLLVISLVTAEHARTAFGSLLGGDYAAFYVAGKILNEYPSGQLYDRSLQSHLFHQLSPAASPQESLPFANPPFVALLFRPLAFLSYRWSYVAWLAISLAVYAAGAALLCRSQPMALWLALSFEPFIMECWIGGQLSAFSLVAVAVALECDRRGEKWAVGVALGLWWYKPTLWVLMLPALIVGREWKVMLGVGASALVVVVASWLGVGWASCVSYAHVLGDYLQTTAQTPTTFRLWKFVDLRSFFGASHVGWFVTFVAAVAILWSLSRGWKVHRQLTWAVALSGTLVANIYVGIYDTVLVVPSLLLLFAARPTNAMKMLAACIFVAPWFSQSLARASGFQVYTVLLAALVVYQLVLLRRFSLESPV